MRSIGGLEGKGEGPAFEVEVRFCPLSLVFFFLPELEDSNHGCSC